VSAILFAILSTTLSAQSPAPPPPSHDLAFRGVFVDQPRLAGPVFARGQSWKMTFADGRATFYPRLRAKADRHWPLAFRLVAAHAGPEDLPIGNGAAAPSGPSQVRLEHGIATEVWDLAEDHVEQSFVFAARPGAGDLRLRIECTTELPVERAASGALRFAAPDGGAVECRDAIVADAAGRTLPLELGWHAGQVILQVPDAFLRQAQWPIIVDPIVRTVAVAQTPTQFARPKASYDPGASVWLVVAEDEVTATDTDILVFRLDLDGTVLDNAAIELSSDQALSPDVGALADHGQFLIAFLNRTQSQVVRRFRDAASTAFGTATTLAVNPMPTSALLGVGGARTGDRGLVCFTTSFATLQQVVAFTITPQNGASALANVGALFQGIIDLDVSDLGEVARGWGMVLRSTASGEFHRLIAGAHAIAPTVSPALNLNVGIAPKIAGHGPFLIASLDAASPPAVQAIMVAEQLTGAFAVSFTANLSALENPAPPSPITNRRDLALASDGCRFVYSFREDHATTPTATILSTIRQARVGLGSGFVFDESRVGLGRVGPDPSLCAAAATGGPVGAYLVLEVDSGPNSNLSATRYDGRVAGDMFTLVPGECGAPFAPLIGASGFSVLGGSYVVQLARTVGVPLLLGGFPEAAPVPTCAANLACLRGVQLPVATPVFGTAIAVTVPCAAGLLGTELAFQGVDLLGPGGCPASAFGVDFRLSDILVSVVR
jgi:hypothetical protein